eukprot:Clim_evm103s108 gene=Clim_evmTU103s108
MAGRGIIGILRETSNVWERRAPISPLHVRMLKDLKGIQVLVQPCTRRVYSNSEYEAAGATITEDLRQAGTILGITGPQSPSELMADRTYVTNCSDIVKMKRHGLAMYDEALAKKVRLVDHTGIIEGELRSFGKRVVGFSQTTGAVGAIDILRGLGERFLAKGYSTPFLGIASAYMYHDLETARTAVEAAGKALEGRGVPQEIGPLVFCVVGDGETSKGVRDILSLLPHKHVEPSDLAAAVEGSKGGPGQTHSIIITTVKESDIMSPIAGGTFDPQHYADSPQEFRSTFADTMLPYASVVLNTAYWDYRFPRLLSLHDMESAHSAGKHRLVAVADLSADVDGSIQFLKQQTTIEHPFYTYDIARRYIATNIMHEDEGILAMATPELAAEMPRDATEHFGSALLKYLPALANDGNLSDVSGLESMAALQSAVITTGGNTTQPYGYINKMRGEITRESRMAEELKDDGTAPTTNILLRGHLFDSGLINRTLDLIEEKEGTYSILECMSQPNPKGIPLPSSAVVQIRARNQEGLGDILNDLNQLAASVHGAEASVKELPK